MCIRDRDMYFGYKNDPLLVELNKLLHGVAGMAKMYQHFPGLENNYTDADGEFSVFEFSGPMVQYTGKKDFSKAREFIYWDNMTSAYACPSIPCPLYQREWNQSYALSKGWVHMWETDEAGSVAAHDGTAYGFDITPDKELPIFIDTVFRQATLHNVDGETVDDLHGIKLNRFRIKHEDLLSAMHNPANAAYDSYGPDGMLNLTAASGFPLFVTKPAFLDGAPELLDGFTGLNQSRDDDTYLDVEPFSGITMRVVKNLQLTGILEDWDIDSAIHGTFTCDAGDKGVQEDWDGHWGLKGNIKDYTTGNMRFYVPYAIVKETEEIGDSDAEDWTGQGQAMLTAAHQLSWWSNIAAGLCAAAVIGLVIYSRIRRPGTQEVEMDAESQTEVPKAPAPNPESRESSDSRHLLDCMDEEE
eukprot:TRINITY_DN4581_c0_g1_i5.p1 TRINITY_DN4581_c0_g1~~TRINITY_DN4581_c0_g1_i5.p1  ORF type:complete len:414 (-),score=115.47 TRINITY_DN4581_c0_g1_i5:85-1326(-)